MQKIVKQWLFLFLFVGFSLLIGFAGSQLSGSESAPQIYSNLNQPSFAPPSWIFAPVWTVLYILMGISAYLIWRKRKEEDIKNSLFLFFVQMFFNLIWPIIFFGFGNYLLAFIDILLLLVLIFLTMKSFYKTSKTATYLLIPYILWVSFASFLNLTFLMIN